ncbi:BnaC09g11840D [Brassica napus]|uniref:BnaC09g11840D protein n=1 Tax=Brassica napus TaxID=3708 RepID=A0A078GK01_BRANA|nr:BnaC09g11840D [Brassica napus]
MDARFHNTGFAASSSPNVFNILGRSLHVQESLWWRRVLSI